jgi:aldose 1-epimerase
MGYEVEEEDFWGDPLIVLSEGDVKARILPSIGFNCIGFSRRGVELIYPPQDAASLSARPSGFGVPILFPFPNRIEDGRFTFEGVDVQLDIPETIPHTIHGFVLNRPWEVIDQGASQDDGAWVSGGFRSEDFPEVTRQFPFPFEVTATYRLKGEALILEIEGKNIPGDQYWPLREDCIPTGERVAVTGKYDLQRLTPIGEETYDDVWSGVVLTDGASACEYLDPSVEIGVKIEADASFREWVTYAPPDKPVICFEPYTCTTNAVNLDSKGIDAGLVRLAPGESLVGTIRIECLKRKSS